MFICSSVCSSTVKLKNMTGKEIYWELWWFWKVPFFFQNLTPASTVNHMRLCCINVSFDILPRILLMIGLNDVVANIFLSSCSLWSVMIFFPVSANLQLWRIIDGCDDMIERCEAAILRAVMQQVNFLCSIIHITSVNMYKISVQACICINPEGRAKRKTATHIDDCESFFCNLAFLKF